MTQIQYATRAELEAGLPFVLQSPKDLGRLERIVRRPAVEQREVLEQAVLSPGAGLVGDSWILRHSSRTPDGSPHPDMQLTLMNYRVVSLVARNSDQWAWAGDQLFLDFDLSAAQVPPGTRLAIGPAIVEVSPQPHTGCHKFAARFGPEALLFVNGPAHKHLQLRGINARVIQEGVVRLGDVVQKLQAS